MYTRPRAMTKAAVVDQPLTSGAPRQNDCNMDPNVASAMHSHLTYRIFLRHVNLGGPDLVLGSVLIPEDDIQSASPQHSGADLLRHSDKVTDDEAKIDGLQVEYRGTEHNDPSSYITVEV